MVSKSKPRKDGGKQEDKVVRAIWLKDILQEALDLIMTTTDPNRLKRLLNDASWKVKKAVLAEALQSGNLDKASSVATHILNLTEVKKAALDANINMNQNVNILLAEITDVPYELLEARAKELQGLGEAKQVGTGADRGRDETPASERVLVVQDGAVQG